MASILLVEDDQQMRALLKLLLTSSGYEVHDVPNGRRAFDEYQQHRFDLVITDLVMPEIDGLEVIMELLRRDKDMRIIAISGAGEDGGKEYLRIAQKLGAQLTLSKPFTNKEFLQAVSLALGKRSEKCEPVDSKKA